MKGWEVVADNLKKTEFSLGSVSALDLEGRTIWISDVAATENLSLCVRMKS